MHPNPSFRQAPADAARAFAAERGFGMLSAAGTDGVMAAHVPFLMDGDVIAAHLVRSNPLARALRDGECPALLAVTGPDGYVSPDWYGVDDQVPTWNYTAVHLRGTLRLLPQERLEAHLDAISARFEAGLAPKAPWTSAKMTEGVMERMMRGIVPVEMSVEGIESTFKLNQNKTDDVRLRAADAIAEGRAAGQEHAALAAMMRNPPA